MKLKLYKTLILAFLFINFNSNLNAKTLPSSFADLAEKLIPSVVNISTTQTITTNANPFPFQFPPGSPFEDLFKDFETPQKRKASALGSGFIIDDLTNKAIEFIENNREKPFFLYIPYLLIDYM